MESIRSLNKSQILENKVRLSVRTYEDFFGKPSNPILVDQYCIHDLPGLLLSPRLFGVGDMFECCSSCFEALKPSKMKAAG